LLAAWGLWGYRWSDDLNFEKAKKKETKMKVLGVSQSRLQWAAYGPRHGDEPMDLPACLGYRGKVGSNPQIMF
jgi:hypothetical protein